MQDAIVKCEKVLLSALSFDFYVQHPFKDYTSMRTRLESKSHTEY